jgi:hypothetical protein
MPHRDGGLENSKCLFIERKMFMRMRLQRVEATLTSAFEECRPCLLVLERKMSRMKFQKSIIIMDKMIYREEILGGMRNMKDIFQSNLTNRRMQYTMTNMINSHTCARCRVHLISSMILVTDGQLLELPRHMIRGP